MTRLLTRDEMVDRFRTDQNRTTRCHCRHGFSGRSYVREAAARKAPSSAAVDPFDTGRRFEIRPAERIALVRRRRQ